MREDVMNPTVDSVENRLRDMEERLRGAGVSNAVWEANQMMASVLGESPVLVPLRRKEDLSEGRLQVLEKMVSGRVNRRPLAHVLGEWDFGGLCLGITPNVLVPRPETEEFLAFVVQGLAGANAEGAGREASRIYSIADIGTGSGCLAIALARRFQEAFVWAVDLSPSALTVACRNAKRHEVAGRMYFLEGDLLAPLSPSLHLDAVVANLPYVDERDMETLPPEVLHEPPLALNGGLGGLDLIHRLIGQTRGRFALGGKIFLEIGHGQMEAVKGLLSAAGYRTIRSARDFAGVERFVMGAK